MFKPVPSKVDFPALEKDILRFWREHHIFEKSIAQRQGCPRFTLYEGPPTVNAAPGIHHVLARVFKDVIPRYKAMKGYYAPRKAGWDTHGLPVELEVERELGISSKPEIETYGVEKFNARCRQTVLSHIHEWNNITERIGFWVDLEHPYITLGNDYIESCWWIVKELWNRGLVYRGYRVTPHCPRCVTSLSSHEVALGYQDDAVDPSVWIKFRIDLSRGHPTDTASRLLASPFDTYFLAWTTTPWTLPGNTALAVAPDAEYAVVEYSPRWGGTERLVLAQALLSQALKDNYRVVGTMRGNELAGLVYEPLFDPLQYEVGIRQLEPPDDSVFGRPSVQPTRLRYPVIEAPFVSRTEGTGIVHIAPAFGEVDYEVGEERRLYIVQPVDLRGIVSGGYPFAGKFVKDADEQIINILESKRLLYRSEKITHTYPFCWRCNTPLLYYAKSSWYIKTTAKKDRLLAGNDQIKWYPEHIKYGRFGDWLQNNVDWAFSRERYWGTPVPIWQCQGCGHIECIGSVEELRKMVHEQAMSQEGYSLDECLKDLHRPFVDNIILRCPRSEPGLWHTPDTMRRIPEVMDCWFDSGAMPLAQEHYPFENQTLLEDGRFPADYICEAVDQTRGWFYSLHALSVLIFDKPCFKNVICLGHILDQKGEKMSKSKGNAVDPWTVLDAQGADALRWYLFTASPAGNVRRFSSDLVAEALRKFMLTLWNTYSFFITYANIDRFQPGAVTGEPQRSELDRWILSELNQLIDQVTNCLDNYDPSGAARRIEGFVDDLSNWYVRRSRRRFWKSENDADKLAAHAALYHCLVTVAKLLAPFAPFLAEELYQNLVRSVDWQAPESVHLSDFPVADRSQIDETLSAQIRLAMKISSLGRAARSKAGIKVRQPLAQLLVKPRSPGEREALSRVAPQVLDELNAKELVPIEDEAEVMDFQLKPNLPLLGPKYGRDLKKITEALSRLESQEIARQVRAGAGFVVGGYQLLTEEVLVSASDKPGYSMAAEGGYTVAVTTALSPDLAAEGWARELVRRLQNMRRSAGFDIADYIITYYQGGEHASRMMSQFEDYIKQETLSRRLIEGAPGSQAYVETHEIDGETLILGVKKVETSYM